MLPTWTLNLIGFTICVNCLTANAAIDPSNFVAPTAASPFHSQSGRQRAILPYSLYQRRLEEQNRLKNQSKLKLTSNATYQQPNEVKDESSQRVLIYLPAFKNANQSQIAEFEADAFQSRRNMMGKLNNSSERSNNAEVVSSNYDSQERSAYSTSNTRQPLPYHKSIFRPRTNSIVTVNQPQFQLNQSGHNSIVKYNPTPLSEKVIESAVPGRPPFVNANSLRKNMFVNGVPLDESTGFNQIIQPLPGNNIMIDQPYQPKPIYSNLAPAPYNTLSSDPSSQNLIESIFSQSQTPVRFAPSNPNLAAGLAQPAAAVQPNLNPLQVLANTANNLGGPEILSQFLGGSGGSPIETISKLARNLLSLPTNNPELLAALTKPLATNAVAEGSKLTSSAIIQPASVAAASEAKNLAGLAATDILFSNVKDEDNANATSKLLKTLPEDQRTLLEAAIQNGEIDSANLTPTLSGQVKDKSILKSDNRLLEWIQQNRPRASEREENEKSSLTTGDKLPYYGRYLGSFVEHANATKRYDISGALWAVDEHRVIVSKFHFKPGSKSENITFWFGPANETGTPADVFPNDNGFFVQPHPVDLNVFMNQQVEVRDANIRPQMQKDEPIVAAEVEEVEEGIEEGIEEEESAKNVTSNELNRSKRDATKTVGSVPLHFEASTNNTDKTVHLTITSPNAETTTATSIDADQSHILISATNNEAVFGKEASESKTLISTPTITPLDWYAGFQPLLLTLPEGRSVRTLHWASVYNHKKKESAAVVLIPNGVAFKIPAPVQLRPLAPNNGYKVSSGAIKALDMKTIEIEDFSLETNGLPVWFMVGKEIVPHAEGQIVPVFSKEAKQFDCDSLRDYKNETITLRLPGQLDIKDVFWFSVFSITKSVSLSHLYVPYNDLFLPPDLLGISTPRCIWKPPKPKSV